MKVPSIAAAQALLADGERRNPGPWVDHLRTAGRVARAIAERHPELDADAYSGSWPDGTLADKRFVERFLADIEFTTYDRLIQLCDALSMPHGPVLMEKRLVDVVLRHGFNARTLPKWQAFVSLREEFDTATGGSIYALLPEVVSNTFSRSVTSSTG